MIDLNDSKYDIKNWNYLYYYDEDLNRIFTAERSLITNSENYTKELLLDFKNKVTNDSELQKKPETYEEGSFQAQYFHHFYEESENIINRIIQSQRKASVLSIFSLIEGQFQLISNLIESEFEFKIKIKHLKGDDYIERYWLYITKVFGVDSKKIEKEYNLIKQQKYVRNKIAHNNSVVDEKRTKFINETKGLRIESFGSESILEICDQCYIMNLITYGERFFVKLTKEIDIRYAEINNIG